MNANKIGYTIVCYRDGVRRIEKEVETETPKERSISINEELDILKERISQGYIDHIEIRLHTYKEE